MMHSGRSVKTDTQTQEWDRYAIAFPDRESVSGPGSTLAFTKGLRAWLPTLFATYRIISILDAPCGDGLWMSSVDLAGIDYLGWDIQQPAIRNGRFEQVNLLTRRKWRTTDLIICRDFMAHIPAEQVVKLLKKFKASGSRYLLATNFPGSNNTPAHPYDRDGFYYRPVDLCAEPFNLPHPVATLEEPGPEKNREMTLFAL